ncbi:MAG: hypothetical protein F6K24_53065 [Okeania sp. SIO2D1]|nr:hypothetical protein [Okeania sp. SIO2D1]
MAKILYYHVVWVESALLGAYPEDQLNHQVVSVGLRYRLTQPTKSIVR